ncbi:MAG: hypothetical protein IPL08_03335 [Saprospiraceae bacterium]|nr:hypothetical protein [Saprospiraceae bacterium]MBK8667937.1 hypothetical protein [Saprospiraceae bacterium]
MTVLDFFQFLFRMNISGSQMLRDIAVLRSETSELKKLLIPFTPEEMELLSLNQSNQVRKKSFGKIVKGIFDTIYYEPLVVYGIKTYSNHQKLILIATTTDEFIYLTKQSTTHVYMNNVEAGVLTHDGAFYNVRQQLIARVDGADQLATHSVWIRGKDVGFISNPKFAAATVPRAYSLLKSMDQDERNIFLCLTLINLVEEAQ